LLTVHGIIQPMRYTVTFVSGTVLWSHLLPTSREMQITYAGLRQGGGVRNVQGVHR
jgi:hypothetical protein